MSRAITKILSTPVPLLLALALAAGCDRKMEAPPAAAATKPASLPSGTATIHGRVVFHGPKLKPNIISVTDPGCDCQEVTEPGEKVSADGGLADAIVYLDIPAAGDGATRPSALLDQVHCNYTPHVLAVQTHQVLNVRSSDNTMHNVHYESARNSSRNLTMQGAGETMPLQFAQPEFISFRCDVHPWMSAWVGVFDHPYFCVTDDAGQYTIDHVPAGHYTLVVWHELLGTRKIEVDVGDGKSVSGDFEFQTPKPAS